MDYVAHVEDDRQRNDEGNIGPYVDEAILPPPPRGWIFFNSVTGGSARGASLHPRLYALARFAGADAYARFANSLII